MMTATTGLSATATTTATAELSLTTTATVTATGSLTPTGPLALPPWLGPPFPARRAPSSAHQPHAAAASTPSALSGYNGASWSASPASGSSGTAIQISYNDPEPSIGGVAFVVDGVYQCGSANGGTSCGISTTGLAEGRHTVSLQSNQHDHDVTLGITVANGAFTVASLPADDTLAGYNGASWSAYRASGATGDMVAVSYTDPGANQATILLDNGLVCRSTMATATCILSTAGLSEGVHTLTLSTIQHDHDVPLQLTVSNGSFSLSASSAAYTIGGNNGAAWSVYRAGIGDMAQISYNDPEPGIGGVAIYIDGSSPCNNAGGATGCNVNLQSYGAGTHVISMQSNMHDHDVTLSMNSRVVTAPASAYALSGYNGSWWSTSTTHGGLGTIVQTAYNDPGATGADGRYVCGGRSSVASCGVATTGLSDGQHTLTLQTDQHDNDVTLQVAVSGSLFTVTASPSAYTLAGNNGAVWSAYRAAAGGFAHVSYSDSSPSVGGVAIYFDGVGQCSDRGKATACNVTMNALSNGQHLVQMQSDQHDHDVTLYVSVTRLISMHPLTDLGSGPSTANATANGNPNVNQTFCTRQVVPNRADPVNCATGDFYDTVDDLSVPGRGLPLQFSRTYNSLSANQDGPVGYGWTSSCNSASLTTDPSGVITTTEGNGSSVTFSPNGSGRYTAPTRVLATLVTNTDGTLTLTRDKDQQSMTFSAPTTTTVGHLVAQTDRNGYATTFGYDGAGRLSTVTDPSDRSLTLSYNDAGRVAQVSDPLSRTVSYGYDPDGNLTAVTDVGGGITHFGYASGTHLLQTITDPRGKTLTMTYDSLGRATSVTDPLGATGAMTYTANADGSQTTMETDPNGAVTVEQYLNNELVSKTEGYGTPQQATWTYTYDPTTLGVASVTDPDGHTSTSTYDSRGNLLSHTDALERTTKYAYDALDDTTAIVDPLGVTTVMTYDAAGNLLTTARPLTDLTQGTTASFVKRDTSTQGSWKDRYGADGYAIVNDSTSYPRYATVTPNGQSSYTWAASGSDVRALQQTLNPTGRIAATWYANDSFTIDANLTDGEVHRVALYCLDWDGNNRTQRVDVLDAVTGAVLDTQSLAEFTNGEYLVWTVSGHVRIHVTNTGPTNAVVSGIFFDPPQTLPPHAAVSATTLTYDPQHPGDVVAKTDPLGHVSHYTYDAYGDRTRVSDPVGDVTTSGYDLIGRKTSVVDPCGNAPGANPLSYTTTLAYDAFGHTTAITDALGRVTTMQYDASQNPLTTTDPLGHQTTFGYDANNHRISVTRPDGAVLTTGYDPAGNVVTQTDALGRQTLTQYDALNRPISVTDPLNRVTTTDYDPAGAVITTTDPLGHHTVYGYDAANERTSVRHADGGITRTQYDLDGRVIARTDPLAHTTTQAYDSLGRLISVTDPLTRTTAYTYDLSGERSAAADPLGRVTTYQYDAANRLITTTDALSGTTLRGYDPAGNTIATTDANGHTTHRIYDADNALTKVVRPDGGILLTQYDGDGRAITTTNALGRATVSRYDTLNRLVSTSDPRGAVTTYQYDPVGRVITTTDALGHQTVATYDAANEKTAVRQADGSTLRTAYDADGNVITTTDALSGTTVYGYDAMNRVVSLTDPLTRTTVYTYDLAGNKAALTDPMDRTTTYGYDAANELTRTTYGDGMTPNVAYTYTATGQRGSMSDGTGTTTYAYDALDRPITVTNGAGQTVSYSYDPVGNVAALTYPDSSVVTRSYDALDRLSSVTDPLGPGTTFSYDGDSNLITTTLPNTTSVIQDYNAANGLTGITDMHGSTTLQAYGYGRDLLGQVTSSGDGSATHSYGYSPLDQLTGDGVGSVPLTTTWSVNGASEISQRVDPSGPTTTTLTYDRGHAVTGATTLSGAATTGNETFSYNGDGDRTSQTNAVDGSGASYGYDEADRLTSAAITSTAGVTTATMAAYGYDGDGLRQSKVVTTTGGVTTTGETWDTAGSLPVLLQDGGVRYVTGPDGLPIEQIGSGGTVLYYLRDQLGSTRALLDSRGATVAAYTYDPYGAVTAYSGTATTPFGFAGQYTDGESGLQYLRARSYDPATMAFLSVDPLVAQTGQAFAYASNDPLNTTDPTGLDPCDGAGFLHDILGCFFHRGVQHGCAGFHALPGNPIEAAECGTLNALHQTTVTLHTNPNQLGPVGGAYQAAVRVQNDPTVNGIIDPFACALNPTIQTAANLAVLGLDGLDPTAGLEALAARGAEGVAVRDTIDLYRAVGVREFDSVARNKAFLPSGNSLEGRQFAFTQDEALRYADNDPNKVAILKATVRSDVLPHLDFSENIDPHIFRNGVITVQPGEQSDLFHEALKAIEHVF